MKEKEWAALIEECRTSGMGVNQWCEKHGIKYRQYHYWVKKLESKEQQWAQVTVADSSNGIMDKKVNLSCGKWTIEIDNETSIQLLRTVLQVVDEICC